MPNGRAEQEGVRIGDIVETINGKNCTNYKMFSAKVRGARDVPKSMLTKCKHLKYLPPIPVKPTLQGSAATFNSKCSHNINLSTQLSTILMMQNHHFHGAQQ
ncbi:unnamed protein product [Brugia timori]|uniref:PDZ domain-containing protein n=1 Tax=Brugia timori TaxID=42155 RepID=A0A3P7V9W1_9BILA|nr:unnamed protein product [Brugia timori]